MAPSLSLRALRSVALAGLVVALVAAGCSGDDSAEDTPPTTFEADAAPTSSSEAPPTTGSVPDGSIDTASPEWTPIDASTGRWLAFTSSRTGGEEIFVVDLGSGDEYQLTDLGEARQPAWSPDRSRIAFQCPREGESDDGDGLGFSDICLVELEGGAVRRLTDDDAFDVGPVWSPDGARIAFHTAVDGGSVVRVVDADGGAEPMEVADGVSPAWSPDATSLAFTVFTDGALVIADLASGEQRTLAGGEDGRASAPAWSPDGEQLSFSCGAEVPVADAILPPSDICVAAVDSGEVRRLTEDESTADSGPVWSPDGARIAFVTSATTFAGFGMPPLDVQVVEADGGGESEASLATVQLGVLAWSPDGSALAVVAADGGIVLIDPATGIEELVVPDPTAGGPRWAPGA